MGLGTTMFDLLSDETNCSILIRLSDSQLCLFASASERHRALVKSADSYAQDLLRATFMHLELMTYTDALELVIILVPYAGIKFLRWRGADFAFSIKGGSV